MPTAKNVKKAEDKKVKAVKKASVVDVKDINFGDMTIRQTNFSDGTSTAKVV